MEGSPTIAAATGFALLLGAGAWRKLRGLGAFEAILADYRLLPRWLIRWAAVAIACCEGALAGVWLAAPWLSATTIIAGIGTALLIAVYGGAITLNLLRGRSWIDCGCGGGEQLSWMLVVRNLVLTGFALLPLAIIDPEPPTWADFAVSAPILAIAALLYLAARTLLENAAAMRPLTEAPG